MPAYRHGLRARLAAFFARLAARRCASPFAELPPGATQLVRLRQFW